MDIAFTILIIIVGCTSMFFFLLWKGIKKLYRYITGILFYHHHNNKQQK